MHAEPFADFRLVGGTALSLQLGHRVSVDIDLFTDSSYQSIDFRTITKYLRDSFPYVSATDYAEPGFGQTYFVGDDEQKAIKLDLFYTDPFVRPVVIVDGIRLANVEDIIAMKMDVIGRGGRMKDFWDLHELLVQYPIVDMIALYKERYPHGHDSIELIKALSDFKEADDDFKPNCLRGKHWELIKLDIISALPNSGSY